MDPITLAVIRGSLEQIADEMDATLERMAFSPVISDGFDRASGIYAANDGAVIVQGPRGLPNFICVMQHTVRSTIAQFNEPRRGGRLHCQRPVPRRHASDGRKVDQTFLLSKQTRVLPGQQRALA